MIVGIGIDIVKVSRIREKVGELFDTVFARKGYTPEELEYARRRGASCYQSLAGFFAAREAFFKATQVRLGWHEIAVDHEQNGKPFFRFTDRGYIKMIERHKDPTYFKFHLSITHEKDYAIAVVICEERS